MHPNHKKGKGFTITAMNKTYWVRMYHFREGAVNMAFNEIYDMAKPKVTAMLKSHFPSLDMSDIHEYYNTAMLDIYNKLEAENIKEGTTLTDIIYTIAHNKAVDDIRRNKKKHDLFIDRDFRFDDVWLSAGTEEIKGMDSALLDAVEDIVSHLDYPCDTLIPSRYYEKMKWEVVAKMSGYSSDKSVHSGHKTCLNKIRAVIIQKYRHLCDFL